MHFVCGLKSGGVEQMIYNYCKSMNLDKYQFIVIYQHEPVMTCKEKFDSLGIKTIRIAARSESIFRNISESISIIRKEQPDIVHAHMNLMNFCALYAAKKERISVRISHSHIAERNTHIFFRILAFFCKKMCIHYATMLFACGVEAGEYLYGKNMVRNGTVKILENAIDLEYYKRNNELRKQIRKELNIQDKIVIGHIGRFSYQKNHERLIAIFKRILQYEKNAILLLVGTGELESTIKNLVCQLGIGNEVIFLGTIKDMDAIYNAMDVFVLPSRFEGLPVVAAEVQAVDLPSLFSDEIDSQCNVTGSIEFISLKENNDVWAKKIIQIYENNTVHDMTKLKEKYDINRKATELDKYYSNSLRMINYE